MSFVFDVLTSPALRPIRGVRWLAKKVVETAESDLLDEGRVRDELLELQIRLGTGKITGEEYDEQEVVLMEWLNIVRETKAERCQ